MNYSDEEKEAIDKIKILSIGDFITWFNTDGCVEMEIAAKTVLNLIQKQEKIIDKMAEKINQAYFDKENMYIWFEEKILPKDEFGLCEYKDLGTRKTRIKEYFKKEVEKDVKEF